MKLRKALGWLFILGVIGYVAFAIMQGQSTESPTGNVVLTEDGREAKVLSFPQCMDTDKGKNYRMKGHTYNIDENVIRDDYCENGTRLVEFFCNNQYPDRIMVSCDCFDGFCRDAS